MRIIAGTHQRRIIKPPSNLPVRPTTDLAKEALFNILNNRLDFEGLKVIDLFAGTGNISFEFASRGAAEVIAVESNFKCVDFINKTIVKQDFENLKVVKADVFRFLSYCRQGFDLIFADPPYDLKETANLPGLVFEKELLSNMGWLIIEHPAAINFKNFHSFVEERNYGRVHFSFFQQPDMKK
jgi:16S rRNA (guanine(966)-N(2))-methyltransferase RsmD